MQAIGRHEDLRQSFRQALALPARFDVASADSSVMGQWDSVAHLQLVVAIEDSFGISLSAGDVVDLDSYNAAVAILVRHGVWPDA